MTGLLPLLLVVLIVLAAAYVPGYLAVRALAGSRPLALSFAPAMPCRRWYCPAWTGKHWISVSVSAGDRCW